MITSTNGSTRSAGPSGNEPESTLDGRAPPQALSSTVPGANGTSSQVSTGGLSRQWAERPTGGEPRDIRRRGLDEIGEESIRAAGARVAVNIEAGDGDVAGEDRDVEGHGNSDPAFLWTFDRVAVAFPDDEPRCRHIAEDEEHDASDSDDVDNGPSDRVVDEGMCVARRAGVGGRPRRAGVVR